MVPFSSTSYFFCVQLGVEGNWKYIYSKTTILSTYIPILSQMIKAGKSRVHPQLKHENHFKHPHLLSQNQKYTCFRMPTLRPLSKRRNPQNPGIFHNLYILRTAQVSLLAVRVAYQKTTWRTAAAWRDGPPFTGAGLWGDMPRAPASPGRRTMRRLSRTMDASRRSAAIGPDESDPVDAGWPQISSFAEDTQMDHITQPGQGQPMVIGRVWD